MMLFSAYPSSMTLGAWFQNLIERVKYFTTWTNSSQQPVSIWLGAFMFPSSFLTSVLQVRKHASSLAHLLRHNNK